MIGDGPALQRFHRSVPVLAGSTNTSCWQLSEISPLSTESHGWLLAVDVRLEKDWEEVPSSPRKPSSSSLIFVGIVTKSLRAPRSSLASIPPTHCSKLRYSQKGTHKLKRSKVGKLLENGSTFPILKLVSDPEGRRLMFRMQLAWLSMAGMAQFFYIRSPFIYRRKWEIAFSNRVFPPVYSVLVQR